MRPPVIWATLLHMHSDHSVSHHSLPLSTPLSPPPPFPPPFAPPLSSLSLYHVSFSLFSICLSLSPLTGRSSTCTAACKT